jgi:cytochrome oxidase Cu insertion factor (SCO1/SenC/PrrC family)
MKNRIAMLSLLLSLVFVLAACGGAPSETMDKPTEEAMMEKATEPAMMGTPTEDAMMTMEPAMTEDTMMNETPTADTMMEAPAWFGASLKDVRSGEAFTINDLKGKVVLVETMAVWCSTCYQQQSQIKSLYESLGMRDDLAIVSLDIDPNEDEAVLKEYTQKNDGFGWQYAIAGADTAREIGKIYGDQFLNPPSAPILVIDRHGVAHPLPFGVKSAEDLMKVIQPYLDEKM